MATENENPATTTTVVYNLRSRSVPLQDDAHLKQIRSDREAQRRHVLLQRQSQRQKRSQTETRPLAYPPGLPPRVVARDRRMAKRWKVRMQGFARRAMNFYNKECSKEGKPTYKLGKLVRYRGCGRSLGAIIHLNFEAHPLDTDPAESPQVELFFADLFWAHDREGTMTIRRCCSLGPKGSESAVSGRGVCYYCDFLHPVDRNFTGRYVDNPRNFDEELLNLRLKRAREAASASSQNMVSEA